MIRLIIVLQLCSGLVYAQTSKTLSSVSERKSFYLNLSKKYNSKGVIEILNEDTENDFEEYIDGKTEKDLIGSYGTVIHELLHGYNDIDFDGHHYFIQPGMRLFVDYGEFYNSKELNKIVRQGQQDSIFRYGLYVGGKQELATNNSMSMLLNKDASSEVMSITKGIYGMLEEFNAYYYGNKAVYELYEYYVDEFGNDDDQAWSDYRHDLLGDATAYYEFNLFMGWYLTYAKNKYPDIYKSTIGHQKLRVVYTLLDNAYADLVNKVDARVAEIDKIAKPSVLSLTSNDDSDEGMKEFFKSMGMDLDNFEYDEVVIENGVKTTRKKSGLSEEEMEMFREEYKKMLGEMKQTTGSSIEYFHADPRAQIAYLKKQYTKEIKEELKKFRIEALDINNYKSFFK